MTRFTLFMVRLRLWPIFALLGVSLLLAGCGEREVLDLRATGPDVPDHLLQCKDEPPPPARPAPGKPRDPKASAHWTLDLAEAGRDCRDKLGSVRGILKSGAAR